MHIWLLFIKNWHTMTQLVRECCSSCFFKNMKWLTNTFLGNGYCIFDAVHWCLDYILNFAQHVYYVLINVAIMNRHCNVKQNEWVYLHVWMRFVFMSFMNCCVCVSVREFYFKITVWHLSCQFLVSHFIKNRLMHASLVCCTALLNVLMK